MKYPKSYHGKVIRLEGDEWTIQENDTIGTDEDAFAKIVPRDHMIYLLRSLSPVAKRTALLHEIGHVFAGRLQPFFDDMTDDIEEAICEEFARFIHALLRDNDLSKLPDIEDGEDQP